MTLAIDDIDFKSKKVKHIYLKRKSKNIFKFLNDILKCFINENTIKIALIDTIKTIENVEFTFLVNDNTDNNYFVIENKINTFLKTVKNKYNLKINEIQKLDFNCCYIKPINDNTSEYTFTIERMLVNRINEFIEMKLRNGNTLIFINGYEFKQCKYLLLNVDITNEIEVENLNENKSIDDLRNTIDKIYEKGNKAMETNHSLISKKDEFLAHCSNIQAFCENDYNWRIIHSVLAFPILRKIWQTNQTTIKGKYRIFYIENLDDYCFENDITLDNYDKGIKTNIGYGVNSDILHEFKDFYEIFCLSKMSLVEFFKAKFTGNEIECSIFLQLYTEVMKPKIISEKFIRLNRILYRNYKNRFDNVEIKEIESFMCLIFKISKLFKIISKK